MTDFRSFPLSLCVSAAAFTTAPRVRPSLSLSLSFPLSIVLQVRNWSYAVRRHATFPTFASTTEMQKAGPLPIAPPRNAPAAGGGLSGRTATIHTLDGLTDTAALVPRMPYARRRPDLEKVVAPATDDTDWGAGAVDALEWHETQALVRAHRSGGADPSPRMRARAHPTCCGGPGRFLLHCAPAHALERVYRLVSAGHPPTPRTCSARSFR